ncbi:Unknown protein [Striga hermonthica]|uniref:GRF-type domain-containing protein n=1 Tax=Striga hermonthica TaxID=68872 RepID=A0A9N7RR03_STRHE|nr:Unknown protein [Striga hermonthica]
MMELCWLLSYFFSSKVLDLETVEFQVLKRSELYEIREVEASRSRCSSHSDESKPLLFPRSSSFLRTWQKRRHLLMRSTDWESEQLERDKPPMSSSSSFLSPSNLFCDCGLRDQLRTSKTPSNPGKKFHGCKNWQKGGCKFFKWEDEANSSNNQLLANELIELKNKMLLLEAENKKMKESVELQFHAQDIYVEEFSKIRQKIWKLEVFVAATWVLFIIFNFVKW